MYNRFYFFLSVLNHGSSCKKLEVSTPYNKLVLSVLRFLTELGYIRGYSLRSRNVVIFLKYFNDQPVIKSLRAVSTPGRRIYWTFSKLRFIVNKTNSVFVLSTNKGLLTSDKAILLGIGGEILFLIH